MSNQHEERDSLRNAIEKGRPNGHSLSHVEGEFPELDLSFAQLEELIVWYYERGQHPVSEEEVEAQWESLNTQAESD